MFFNTSQLAEELAELVAVDGLMMIQTLNSPCSHQREPLEALVHALH